MKTANELRAIADAVNAAKEEARKVRAKEVAADIALKCEIEAEKGERSYRHGRYHSSANEELIIDELKAHNYEVTIEDCQLIIRW